MGELYSKRRKDDTVQNAQDVVAEPKSPLV